MRQEDKQGRAAERRASSRPGRCESGLRGGHASAGRDPGSGLGAVTDKPGEGNRDPVVKGLGSQA